jgi:hypothetical protein
MIQNLPSASHPDVTAPTFAGIVSLVAQSDGALLASWAAATEVVSLPVGYPVYIMAGAVSAAALFQPANLLFERYALNARIYTDAAGVTLTPGAVYTVGVQAEDAVGNASSVTALLTATVTYNLYALVAATPAAVWDVTRGPHATVGTFGETNQTSPDNADIAAIKVKTDNLPADPASNTQVNTRLAAAAYTAPDNADILLIKAKTDNLPADPASNMQVNTRLASAAYTAPDNADILLIKAKTDNLPVDPASNTQVNTRLAAAAYTAPDNTDIAAIKTKTDQLSFAVDGVNAHVNNSPAINVQDIVDGVWNEPTATHTTAGTFGENAQTPAINPSQVADAVWDAPTASHTTAGTFGQNAQTPSINPSQVADAVWDAQTSAHVQAGSMGLAQVVDVSPSPIVSFSAFVTEVPALEALLVEVPSLVSTLNGVPSLVAIMID